MPRYPRSWTLQPGSSFHKTWKAHNSEWNLKTSLEKQSYLHFLKQEHEKNEAAKNVLHALCLMSNHSHEVYTLDDLESFSNFMRQHHGRYGMFFNRLHKRRGKVALDRPHTNAIENQHHHMMVTFYIHANPIRAGICKDAKDYVWSTHMLYAYGKKSSWMKGLIIHFPQWYLDLGSTWRQRRAKYRKCFDQYLLDFGLRKQKFSCYGVGSYHWVRDRKKNIREMWMKKISNVADPPSVSFS
ncbi:MAG: hypothetical protein R3A11_04125 [Bdellovibrionota bacterium]